MKNIFTKILPHLIAIVVFVTVSGSYFSPYFSGYELEQNDISQFLGMSKEIADCEALTGDHVQWTNQLFGGMPAYQISPDTGGNWIKKFEYAIKLGLPRPVGILFMAMLGMYILGICVKIKPWISILGGLAFGLASINILYIGAGHMSKVNAIAYMAPVLGGLLLTMRGKLLLGGAVTTLFLALHLTANHFQMTYYLVYLLLFTGVSEAVRLFMNGQFAYLLKSAGVLLIAALLAILPTLSSILDTYEYGQFTTRSGSELTINPDGSKKEQVEGGLTADYILEYSFGRGEIFSLMIPNVKGGKSGILGDKAKGVRGDSIQKQLVSYGLSYWGRQAATGGAFYFGIIIVMLFVVGLVILKGPLKWGLLALTLLAVVLSWRDATGLTDFFIQSVPAFSKFRDTKMMLVLVQIIMPFTAMLSLDRIISEGEKIMKPVMISAGAFVFISALFAASPDMFFDFTSSNDEAHYAQILAGGGIQDPSQIDDLTYDALEAVVPIRVEIFKEDALRGLGFVVVALAMIFVFLKSWIDVKILIPVLSVLVVWDMYSVDLRYLNKDTVKKSEKDLYPSKKAKDYISYTRDYDKFYPFQPTLADEQIFQREKVRYDGIEEAAEVIYKKRLAQFSKTPRNKDLIKQVSEFGALSLLSNFRVFTLIAGNQLMNPTQDGRTSYFHKSLGGYHGAKLRRYQDVITFHLGLEMSDFVKNFNTLGPAGAFDKTQVINMLNTRYLVVGSDRPAVVNTAANGNAWFVDEVVSVDSADEEISKLSEIDTKKQAVVCREFESFIPNNLQKDSTAYIAMDEYAPEHISYVCSSSRDQLAIFSEIYYPDGWTAYIDGKEVEHFRANYILRALNIPAGEHDIEFVFESSGGQGFSLFGSLMVLLLSGFVFYKEIRAYTKLQTT